MMAKNVKDKISLSSSSSLINNTVSPSSPAVSCSPNFTHLHLPPVTTRIYPKITLVPKHNNNNTKGRKVRIKEQVKSTRIVVNYFLWFCTGILFLLSALWLSWNLNLVTISLNESKGGHPLYGDISSGEKTWETKCTSSICMQAAARLLSRINSSQDPCKNFYQFSCGNFITHNEVPDDGFQRSTLQEMQEALLVEIKKLIDQPGSSNENIGVKRARQLYSSCMHNNFRTSHYTDYKFLPIFNALNVDGVGNWPILQGINWNESEFNLERLFAQLFAHQVQSVVKLYVSPDETDPTKYILEFYKGEPAMASEFFFNMSQPDYVKYLRSYKRLLLESVLILSHGKQGSPTVAADVDAILNFETRFAKLSHNSTHHLNGFNYDIKEDGFGHVTIQEISIKIPQINWLVLIQNLFDNLGVKRKVTEEMALYFHCSDFFLNLVSLIEQTDKRTVSNYLVWRFVFRYMPFLGNKFLQIWMEFMKDVPDTNEERLHLSRWKQCASIVNDGFGLAIAYLYIQNSIPEKTIQNVKEMITYLKKAFEIIIHEQVWIPDSFKADLVDKLMSMRSKIGYPSYILDTAALEKEYEGLEFNEEYFLMNILTLRKFEVLKEIRKVDQAVDKEKDWIILPLVANAFHNPIANEIVLPLGILRYPMYHDSYPMYLNFANLGIVIGHEMTHGFDHHGRFYDKNGNFTSWWPEEVVTGFRKQAVCFTDQYSQFAMSMVEKRVDGNNTLADNICDNSALRLSWLAYELWTKEHGLENGLPGVNYTISQLFYMNFAQIWCEVLNKEGYEQYVRDPHSPGEFRTLGVAQNNKLFGEVFNCPKGSPMNPQDKCILWS